MIFAFLFDLIFPPRCASCNTVIVRGGALCVACRAGIPYYDNLFCGRCRARIPPGSMRSICHPSFPYILGAATRYEGAIKDVVHVLKFQNIREAALELGNLLTTYIKTARVPTEERALISIPLSRKRLKERGYNQSELIAEVLSSTFTLPIVHALTRTKNTHPQSHIKGSKERWKNIAGCFVAIEERVPKYIFLIDDVCTSGATLYEAALVLKKHGAKKIIALVAAKA